MARARREHANPLDVLMAHAKDGKTGPWARAEGPGGDSTPTSTADLRPVTSPLPTSFVTWEMGMTVTLCSTLVRRREDLEICGVLLRTVPGPA